MATTLVALALALSTSILAAPFPPYNLAGRSSFESNSASCTDPSHCRTQWSIVYSCLGAIFASVWVSFHPNIPARAREKNPLPPQFERPAIAIYMLIFPEMLVGTALAQRWAAWKVSQECKTIEGMLLEFLNVQCGKETYRTLHSERMDAYPFLFCGYGRFLRLLHKTNGGCPLHYISIFQELS
jgi:hypothetical protein